MAEIDIANAGAPDVSASVETQPSQGAQTVGGFANVNLNGAEQTASQQVNTLNAGQQAQPQQNETQSQEQASDNVVGNKQDVEKQAQQDKVPEAYSTFQYNGEDFDPHAQEAFSLLCKDLNLTQSQAETTVKTIGDYLYQSTVKTQNEWREATVNDPELGGRNLATTQKYANKALSDFFSVKCQSLLQEMGLFNNPDFIRGLRKIGMAMATDSPRELVGGNSQARKALRENPLKAAYSKYDDPNVL